MRDTSQPSSSRPIAAIAARSSITGTDVSVGSLVHAGGRRRRLATPGHTPMPTRRPGSDQSAGVCAPMQPRCKRGRRTLCHRFGSPRRFASRIVSHPPHRRPPFPPSDDPVGASRAIPDFAIGQSPTPLQRIIKAKLRSTGGSPDQCQRCPNGETTLSQGGRNVGIPHRPRWAARTPLSNHAPCQGGRRGAARRLVFAAPPLRPRRIADPNNGSGRKTGAVAVSHHSHTVPQRQP